MRYILKIYDGIYGDIVSQRDDFSSIDIKNDISDISTATIKSKVFSGINEMDRIDICRVEGEEDIVLFSGIVRTFTVVNKSTEITLSGMKSLLQRKHITADISTTSFDTLMTTFFAQWLVVGETLTIEREEEFVIEGDAHGKGKSIYDILSDVCGETYAFDFDVLDRKIIVKKTLGNVIGKTYTYSPYHLDNDISSVKLVQQEYVRNVIIDFDTLAKTYPEGYSFDKYGYLSGDQKSTETLGVKKDFSLTISNNELSAGDTLNVELLGNEYIEYYGMVYVVRENITIDKGGLTKSLEVSNIISKEVNLTNMINLALKQ